MKASAFLATALTVLFTMAAGSALAHRSGGQYTLQITLQKQGSVKSSQGANAFPIDSIDFGSSNNVSNGSASGKTQLSPVTITTTAASTDLAQLAIAAISNEVITKMEAIYRDSTGTEQFEVQFKDAVISKLTFPSATLAGTPIGETSITFRVRTEATVYPDSSQSTGGASTGGSKKPITPPHILIQHEVIPSVWRGLSTSSSPVKSSQFTLTLPKTDTSGVTAIGPVTFEMPAATSGLAAGKLQLSPLTLTVSAPKASPFGVGKEFDSGTLTYAAGGAPGLTTLTLHFKLLKVASTSFAGSSGSQPTMTVTLNFQEVSVSTP